MGKRLRPAHKQRSTFPKHTHSFDAIAKLTTKDIKSLPALRCIAVNVCSLELSKLSPISWYKRAAVERDCTFQQSYAIRRQRTRWQGWVLRMSPTLKRLPASLAAPDRSQRIRRSTERDLFRKNEIWKSNLNVKRESIFLNLREGKLNSPRTEERLKNCRNEEHLLSAKLIWEHSRDDSACRDAKEETHFADNFQIFLIAYEIPLAVPSVAETIRHVELPSFALHHFRRIRNWIICLVEKRRAEKWA